MAVWETAIKRMSGQGAQADLPRNRPRRLHDALIAPTQLKPVAALPRLLGQFGQRINRGVYRGLPLLGGRSGASYEMGEAV